VTTIWLYVLLSVLVLRLFENFTFSSSSFFHFCLLRQLGDAASEEKAALIDQPTTK
jgi:hypothetical protein